HPRGVSRAPVRIFHDMTPSPHSASAIDARTDPEPLAPTGGPDLLLGAAILAVAGALTRAALFTPVEATQGPAQKIFYVHAPSAFLALYVGFGLLAISSALYLWLREE